MRATSYDDDSETNNNHNNDANDSSIDDAEAMTPNRLRRPRFSHKAQQEQPLSPFGCTYVHSCDNASSSSLLPPSGDVVQVVRVIRQPPPIFRLSRPPNPLDFVTSVESLYAAAAHDENEKFLVYSTVLNEKRHRDANDQCANFKLHLATFQYSKASSSSADRSSHKNIVVNKTPAVAVAATSLSNPTNRRKHQQQQQQHLNTSISAINGVDSRQQHVLDQRIASPSLNVDAIVKPSSIDLSTGVLIGASLVAFLLVLFLIALIYICFARKFQVKSSSCSKKSQLECAKLHDCSVTSTTAYLSSPATNASVTLLSRGLHRTAIAGSSTPNSTSSSKRYKERTSTASKGKDNEQYKSLLLASFSKTHQQQQHSNNSKHVQAALVLIDDTDRASSSGSSSSNSNKPSSECALVRHNEACKSSSLGDRCTCSTHLSSSDTATTTTSSSSTSSSASAEQIGKNQQQQLETNYHVFDLTTSSGAFSGSSAMASNLYQRLLFNPATHNNNSNNVTASGGEMVDPSLLVYNSMVYQQQHHHQTKTLIRPTTMMTTAGNHLPHCHQLFQIVTLPFDMASPNTTTTNSSIPANKNGGNNHHACTQQFYDSVRLVNLIPAHQPPPPSAMLVNLSANNEEQSQQSSRAVGDSEQIYELIDDSPASPRSSLQLQLPLPLPPQLPSLVLLQQQQQQDVSTMSNAASGCGGGGGGGGGGVGASLTRTATMSSSFRKKYPRTNPNYVRHASNHWPPPRQPRTSLN